MKRLFIYVLFVCMFFMFFMGCKKDRIKVRYEILTDSDYGEVIYQDQYGCFRRAEIYHHWVKDLKFCDDGYLYLKTQNFKSEGKYKISAAIFVNKKMQTSAIKDYNDKNMIELFGYTGGGI